MAETTQLAERVDYCAGPSAGLEMPATASRAAASARVRNGNTVVTFADRSTMTLLGITRLDQVRFFSRSQLRAIWRVL